MKGWESNAGRSAAGGERFATTHWSIVVRAADGGKEGRASDADRALAELCRAYWYPLYVYVRRRGHASHEAEDLTQEFFLRLLEKNYLAEVDRHRGKFRSFLLASLKHFLANEWDRGQSQKRGGGQMLIRLDAVNAECRYALEPSHDLTPEKLFERQWALAVLEQVLGRLQAECVAEGKRKNFEVLKQFLTVGKNAGGHAQAAAELGMTEGAVKTAVHRLRRRYRTLLREEIAQTVASPEEIDDEIRQLMGGL